MRKKDIQVGTDYIVPTPADLNYGRRNGRAKATAVEVGVKRRHSTLLDGVLVRVAEDTIEEGAFLSGRKVLAAGSEYVVPARYVARPWTAADDEEVERRRRIGERAAQAEERLLALGLAKATDDSLTRLREPENAVPGFVVLGNRRDVQISIEALLPWLDTLTVSGDA